MLRMDGMPVKGNNEDGDAMLWAGLMSYVGDTASQQAIKRCQNAEGRLYRSPRRVDTDTKNSFSRDMAMGFILYFCATQDHAMADKWIAYIRKTGSMFPKNESDDNRWLVTPTLWWLMSFAGMKVPLFWRATRFLYKYILKVEIATVKPGYGRHLKGCALLVLAHHYKKRNRELGNMLWMREPGNAMFAYLAGMSGTACAMTRHLQDLHDRNPGDGTQWCWERTDSENAWKNSMGWDFCFIDLLLSLNIK